MNAGSYEEVIASAACLIYGKLKQKRKTGSWNSLRCAVWDKFFLCFKDETDQRPRVAFVLDGFQVSDCADTDEIHVFQLSKPGVIEHLFASESLQVRSRWIAKLKEAGVKPTLEDITADQRESNAAAKIVIQEDASDEEMAGPYFPSVDIDAKNIRSLSTNDSAIHTSQSFDSIARIPGNSTGTQLHRSAEIENLFSLSSDNASGEELSFTLPKERGKSLLQEVFEALDLPEIPTDGDASPNNEGEDRNLDTTDGLIAAVSALNTFIKSTTKTDSDQHERDDEKKECAKVTLQTYGDDHRSNQGIDSVDGRNKSSQRDETDARENKTKIQFNSGAIKPAFLTTKSSPLMEGFVNVNFPPSIAWKQMWAILELERIDLCDSPENSEFKRKRIAIRGLQFQPLATDTGRFLSFKLVRANGQVELEMEAKDDEDLGRWVSGLFRSIHHSNKADREDSHRPPPPTPAESTSTGTSSIVDEEMNDVVSVKEIREVFETKKSGLSSPAASVSTQNFNYEGTARPSSSSTPNSPISLPDNITPEELDSSYEKMKQKLESKYADVVCWLGRYIEQEEEKQVLSVMANPYLAKLRIRHKLEMVAQIDGAIVNLEQTIESLREKLALKALKKDKKEVNQPRLIRCAEDAKRTTNELKRIDKETAVIEKELREARKQLDDMKEAARDLQREIEMAYSQFDWGGQNGHAQPAADETDSQLRKKGEPEWTKIAKEKAKAWQNVGDDIK